MSTERVPLQKHGINPLVSPAGVEDPARTSCVDAFSPTQLLSPARRLVLARLQRDALGSPRPTHCQLAAASSTSDSDGAAHEAYTTVPLSARLDEVDALLLAMSPRMPAVLRQQQHHQLHLLAASRCAASGAGEPPVALPSAGVSAGAFPCQTAERCALDHASTACRSSVKLCGPVLEHVGHQPDVTAMRRDLASHAAAIDDLHASIQHEYTQALEALARWSVAAAAGGAVVQLQLPACGTCAQSAAVPVSGASSTSAASSHQHQQQSLDEAAAVAGALVATFARETAVAAAHLKRTADACRHVRALCDVNARCCSTGGATTM